MTENLKGQAKCNKCNTEYWFDSLKPTTCPTCGSDERKLTDAREYPSETEKKSEE